MSTRDALAVIVNRNQFYRDGYRILLKIAFGQVVVIGLLLAVLIVFYASVKPQYRFFATTSDGRIIDLVPLDQPYRDDVLAWATQAARDATTFAYHDYQLRLQAASSRFTTTGWNNFVQALDKSGILEAVKSRRLAVVGRPDAAPQVVQQGVVNGVYRWEIQMPFTIEYMGAESQQVLPARSVLTLIVQRMPNLENPDGIGIEQWVQEQR